MAKPSKESIGTLSRPRDFNLGIFWVKFKSFTDSTWDKLRFSIWGIPERTEIFSKGVSEEPVRLRFLQLLKVAKGAKSAEVSRVKLSKLGKCLKKSSPPSYL